MKKVTLKDPSEKNEHKSKLRSSRSMENNSNNEAGPILSPKTRRRTLITRNKSQEHELIKENHVATVCPLGETGDRERNATADIKDIKTVKIEAEEPQNDQSNGLNTGLTDSPHQMNKQSKPLKTEDEQGKDFDNFKETKEKSCPEKTSGDVSADDDVKTDMRSNRESPNERQETITERRERRKAKSKYSSLDNDDLEKMLKWKNGIGHLAGSNLKFRKSDIGALEVITPSSDEEDAVSDGDRKGKKKRGPKKHNEEENEEITPKRSKTVSLEQVEEKRKRKERKKKKFAEDELLKCETCGCYGLISEFRSSGRFCSQRCVGAYASKKRAEMIAQQFANGERPLPKSSKKSFSKKRKPSARDTLSPKRGQSPLVEAVGGTAASAGDTGLTVSDNSALYYESIGHYTKFDWDTYLQVCKAEPAPLQAFIKEFPEQAYFPVYGDQFKPTMKLECVDPKHQSHFCVVTVVELQGARMRLHFDGWSESYDFWINCDSPFLHPCGWCKRNGHILTPPKGMTPESFSWTQYLEETGCEAATDGLFHEPSPICHGFKTNMKLEAIDRKNPDLVCVASVNNVVGNHFLIHFDEWDDLYDYWCKDDSPFIHPVGWCQQVQIPLVPPTDEMVNKFQWDHYLQETNCIAAPPDIFKEAEKVDFKIGTKLEVIDPRNSSLARVATVGDIEDYRIKIHFDGWDDMYDYWFDYDSTDLHPVNWCKKTGHVLEPPPNHLDVDEDRPCGTPGCRGIGHIKGLKYTTHHTSFGCPYTLQNINRTTSPVVDRLAPNAASEETSIANRVHRKKMEDVLPDSTTKEENKKSRQRYSGRASKKYSYDSPTPSPRPVKAGAKRKARRRSDEVSSSTSPTNNVNDQHSNSYLTKPIPPTHRPAGKSNMMYHDGKVVSTSKAIPWSPDEVVEFVKNVGYEDLAPCFRDNQIDGQALLLLSQADLVHHMKLKLGPALKIYSEISKL